MKLAILTLATLLLVRPSWGQSLHVKDDTAVESLADFKLHHPHAICEQKTTCTKRVSDGLQQCIRDADEDAVSCDDLSGFTFLGYQFTPHPELCPHNEFNLQCGDGTISARFQHGKLQYETWRFHYDRTLMFNLAKAFAEKYGKPTVETFKGSPDPTYHDHFIDACPFDPTPVLKSFPVLGNYRWDGDTSWMTLTCDSTSLNNGISLYRAEDHSKDF